MKIFNWVHRKFSCNGGVGYVVSPKKDDICKAANKTEPTVTNEIDTNSLLGPITLMEAWKDGMLTIGTFGFDEYSVIQEEEEEEEEEKHKHKQEQEEKERDFSSREKENEERAISIKVTNLEKVANLKPEIAIMESNNTIQNVVEETPETTPLLEVVESEISIVRKRVTLADLLSVAADAQEIPDSTQISVATTKKSADIDKKGRLSFGKKHKEEDSRPKRKLHRMISKMLKKKIYPDVEGKSPGKDGLNRASEPVEMVSLIQVV
ncbi:hypothetical protein ACHQM5_011956 [Ranunculus cassubicifolius]